MDYLTVIEAAEELQLSVPTIKRYIYEGKLKSSKLPGGQHRIPHSEIERLLDPGSAEDHGENAAAQSVEARLDVIERWLTEMQAEMERLAATQEVLGHYFAQGAPAVESTSGDSGNEVLVLGPGCKKCNTLHERASRVLKDLGRDDIEVRHVTDLDDIASFGPVLTPALVIGGQIVVSGRVPADAALKNILSQHIQ